MSSTNTFSLLENEFNKDTQIENLNKEIELLKNENQELKHKEFERTKSNPEAECLCLYVSVGEGSVIFGEEKQLVELMRNCPNPKNVFDAHNNNWCGSGYRFKSCASAKTWLLRNGYKFMYESNIYHMHGQTAAFMKLENWVRGI